MPAAVLSPASAPSLVGAIGSVRARARRSFAYFLFFLVSIGTVAAQLPASCNVGPSNANAHAPAYFAETGTVLVLVVGDSQHPLVAGVAQPLTLVELDTVSGAARTTLPLPSTGNTVGANLACTLSVGMFANASWDWRLEQQFYADHCANTLNATFFGAPPPSQGGPACDAAGTVPASPRYAADWNADPIGLGHGDGVYPLWYWDREASLSVSYDGRFVSFPCYARNQSLPLQLGSWFAAAGGDAGNPLCSSTDLFDPFCYDDKVVAVVDAAGRVDTVTHLPGTDFFYGALVPDEPQYVRSAVTVGEFAPDVAFFVGGAADNGEGVMWLPDDATSPTKSGNRITNTPGYFDFGSLSLASPTGTPPAVFSAGDSPLAFVTSPSMLNAGAESAQHAALRGLSVMTVGGVPALSKDEAAAFMPLHGFDAYVGHPFDAVWQGASSVWFADAGPGATGGPATCAMLGNAPCPPPIPGLWNATAARVNGTKAPAGLWDKYSCTIQHWVSEGGMFGNWSWVESVVVSNGAPCFAMAGRDEPDAGGFVLYVTTSSLAAAEPSRLYRVNVADAPRISVVSEAPPNTQYRAVALPPQPRANYTCPPGQFGKACDLACAFDCCAPCTVPVCGAGQHLEMRCSLASDNVCVADAVSATSTPTMAPQRSPMPAAGAAGAGPAVDVAAAVCVPLGLVAAAAAGLALYARAAGVPMATAAARLGAAAAAAAGRVVQGATGAAAGGDGARAGLLTPRSAAAAAAAQARAATLASGAPTAYGSA
jgi:hypothetical protein